MVTAKRIRSGGVQLHVLRDQPGIVRIALAQHRHGPARAAADAPAPKLTEPSW